MVVVYCLCALLLLEVCGTCSKWPAIKGGGAHATADRTAHGCYTKLLPFERGTSVERNYLIQTIGKITASSAGGGVQFDKLTDISISILTNAAQFEPYLFLQLVPSPLPSPSLEGFPQPLHWEL